MLRRYPLAVRQPRSVGRWLAISGARGIRTTLARGMRILDNGVSALCAHCTAGPERPITRAGQERRLPRWEQEQVLNAVRQRFDANPNAMRQRPETVEQGHLGARCAVGS